MVQEQVNEQKFGDYVPKGKLITCIKHETNGT